MAESVNWEVFKGNSFVIQLAFTNNGAVQDITGWTIYFTVKNRLSDPDALAVISQTITNHLDPTNGLSVISVLATTMEKLIGVFPYDVTYKDTSGAVTTFMTGSITINLNATRRASA